MEMTLKEGKNREIRRMCEAVGLEVVRLKRNAEGVVKLGMLKPGTYRELTKAEVNGLRAAAAKGRAQTRSASLQSKLPPAVPRACGQRQCHRKTEKVIVFSAFTAQKPSDSGKIVKFFRKMGLSALVNALKIRYNDTNFESSK